MSTIREFESRSDAARHWLAIDPPDMAHRTVHISIVNDDRWETISMELSAEEVREMALWLIDAYEAMGHEFPGLERL